MPWKTISRWLVSLALSSAVSGVIGYYVGQYLNRSTEEEKDARYAVAAMLLRCPVKDSRDLDARVSAYLTALRRAKADGRGGPEWREDCSIGVNWSITISERIKLN